MYFFPESMLLPGAKQQKQRIETKIPALAGLTRVLVQLGVQGELSWEGLISLKGGGGLKDRKTLIVLLVRKLISRTNSEKGHC